MTRICIHCGEEKDLEDFVKAKSCKQGRKNQCKKCEQAAYRKRRAEKSASYVSRKSIREEVERLLDQGLKKCSACQSVKPLDQFYNNKAQWDGKGNTCKQCQNKSNITSEGKRFAPKRSEAVRVRKNKKNLLTEGYKNCSRCGDTKRIDEFNKSTRSIDGLHAWCRVCQSSTNEVRYEEIRPDDRPRITVFESDEERKEAQREQGRKYNYLPVPFDTYGIQIPVTDVPSFNENHELTVVCKLCGKRFTPTRSAVKNRIGAFNGEMQGELNFYCSDICRQACPVYRFNPHQSVDPRSKNYIPPTEAQYARSCQTDHLKQLQCDKTGHTHCERCGDIIDVELHHTQEVTKHGDDAINSAGHLLLCAGCHTLIHNNCN